LNLIDAQLRIGLILRQQIKTKSKTIHKALLFQGEQDKPISEREIYKRALAEGVINQGLYSTLDELYTDRNKVIHRYIVSDLRTEGVLEIGIRYEKMQTAVRDAIFAIEEEQIRLGVGMTVKGPTFEGAGAIDWLAEMSMEKHGKEMAVRCNQAKIKLTNRSSQPLAAVKSSFVLMKSLWILREFAAASGGLSLSR
jgi:hypothetical protein